MSTVPEVILARHAGLRVAAVSAITNLAEGMGGEELSHEQTLRNADAGGRRPHAAGQRFCEELALMLAAEVIRRKRDGHALTREEIEFLVGGITDGSLSDAQVGALAMAMFLRGMDAGRARRADRGDARLGRGARVGPRPAGARQALDRRRRRQGVADAGADGRRLRRRRCR